MRLLFDTELYAYRLCISHTEEYEWSEGEWSTFIRVPEVVESMLFGLRDLENHAIQAANGPLEAIILCHGDRGRSFRRQVYPDYKRNRTGRKPVGYRAVMEQILAVLQAQSVTRTPAQALAAPHDLLEGDDAMGIEARPGQDALVSFDKDFATVPGTRFLFRPWDQEAPFEVHKNTLEQADYNLFTQALVGDKADGYPGCPGVGAAKAAKLLEPGMSEAELWDATLGAFLAAGQTESQALAMVQCARILRPGEYDQERRLPILWKPPAG
jgi:5'-3' exonuclease